MPKPVKQHCHSGDVKPDTYFDHRSRFLSHYGGTTRFCANLGISADLSVRYVFAWHYRLITHPSLACCGSLLQVFFRLHSSLLLFWMKDILFYTHCTHVFSKIYLVLNPPPLSQLPLDFLKPTVISNTGVTGRQVSSCTFCSLTPNPPLYI